MAFVSYVRRKSAVHAQATHDLLRRAGVPVFLDVARAPSGEGIPERVLEGLLAARVVVVFFEREYFTRRYCGEEWTIAIMAYRALLRHGADAEECAEALRPIVVVRPAGGDLPPEWERLPPELKDADWPAADARETIADLVRSRLEQVGETIGERLQRLGELTGLRDRVQELMAIPDPQSLRGIRVYHERGLPPSIGEAFVGRAQQLWELHSLLSSPQHGGGTAAVTTALEGGGGFGKTRLALEYVHRYGPKEYSGGIFWVNADGPEDRLEAQMHGILRLLRPLDTPDLEAFRASRRSAARELGQALYALGEPDRALYVVDNVPEVAGRGQPMALDHWCPAVGGVTLLVTSRAHQSVLQGVGRLELRELSTTSAVRLLTHDFTGRDELDDTEWGRISEWVGEWPLALELLNAALREGAVTPRELLASSEGRAVDELDRQMDAISGAVPAGMLRGATEALGVSYLRLPAEARVSARLLGWLAPDPIPVALVHAFSDGLMQPRARVLLRARSLVSGVGRSGVDSGSIEMYGKMHRVLADYLRRAADDPESELRSVCDVLVRVMDADACRDPAQWPLMDACRPHAEAVVGHLAELRSSPQLVATGVQLAVHHVGLLLRVQGEPAAAATIQKAAVDLAVSALGEEHTDTLRAMDALGVTLRINGDPRRAHRLQERALRIRRRLFGAEHPETLWVMSNLADTLRARGDRATALRLQEEVLDARRRVLGAEHPDTLRAMASLGVTLRVLGDVERARRLHEDVLGARRRALGDDHSDTFDAMAILAATMRMLGEVASARPLEEAVLAWRRRFLGERHPGTLWAMSYLAETLRAGGELRQAVKLAQDAVEGWCEVFGESHPDTLWAMGNLAETRRVSGDLAHAAELLQTVMEGRLSVLGDVHPDTLWAVTSLAEVKHSLGDTAAAKALALQADRIRRRLATGTA